MPSSERCSIRAFSFLRTRPPSRCSFSLCSGKRPEPWLPKNGAPPSPTFNFSFPNVSPPAERKLHRKSDSLRARRAADALTLLTTCKRMGIHPRDYLRDTLAKILAGEKDLTALLPETYAASLAQRAPAVAA